VTRCNGGRGGRSRRSDAESCWAVLGAANDLGDAYQNVTANYLVGRANTAMTLLVGRSISIEGS
jgi:hypothetical protein